MECHQGSGSLHQLDRVIGNGVFGPVTRPSGNTRDVRRGTVTFSAACGTEPDTRRMGREACFREWAEHAALLVEMGVDLIQAEYLGFIEDCLTAFDACSQTGATVCLGIRHIRPDGTMQYGERLEDLAEALEGRPVGAILLMCSNPEAISVGLPPATAGFLRSGRGLSQLGVTTQPGPWSTAPC